MNREVIDYKFHPMAVKKESGSYANKLAIYEKVVATIPSIERKGDTMPYTSLNGNMFLYLEKTAHWVFVYQRRIGRNSWININQD